MRTTAERSPPRRSPTRVVDEAHAAVADLLGVDAREVILGANMTTLTFHLSRSIAAAFGPGDEIVVSGLDHAANVDPWIAMAKDRDLVIRWWEPRLDDCTLHIEDLKAVLSPRTRLVAAGWASNAVGTINPVAEVVAAAHAVGAWAYVDAVHAAPHLTIDARAVDADFVACSVYKFFGPHVGAVYGRASIMETLATYKVRPSNTGFETGTGNFEGYAGALAAIGYLEDVGTMAGVPAGASRRDRLVGAMEAIRTPRWRSTGGSTTDSPRSRASGCSGSPTRHASITGRRPRPSSWTVCHPTTSRWPWAARGSPSGMATSTRPGSSSASGFAESGGIVRIGLTHYNTAAEVDRLLEVIGRIAADGR